MDRLLAMAMLIVAAAMFCCTTSAQTAPADLTTFHSHSEEVLVDVLALDRKGHPVELRLTDLRLSEDGVVQQLTSFSRDQLPLSIVLLFDLTDTVRPVLQSLAHSARDVLAHLKPQDEVAVMVFSSSAQLLQDFTTDRALAAYAIAQAAKMETADATFLNEDLSEAVLQSRNSRDPHSRHVLLWLTDGTANIPNDDMKRAHGRFAPPYLHSEQEATHALLSSGAVVTALIEESDLSRSEIARARFEPMELLMRRAYPPGDVRRWAELTGGSAVTASGEKHTAERLAELLDELRGRYTLGYRPSQLKPAGRFCSIRIQLTPEAAARLGKVKLQARTGYYRAAP
jgi:VWFA-related protein